MYKIGIDLGGTKIEGIILDKDLKEVFRDRIPTEQQKGYQSIIKKLGEFYFSLSNKIKQESHSFGIGTPGSVSLETGFLKNSNTTCLNGQPFLKDLENFIQRKVVIENDANCFAMAEAMMGAGRNYEMVFGVIMGTGCGGGIIYNGELIKGKQSLAGEWGHMVLHPDGNDCYCGKKGCVETYISGGGLERRYKELTGARKTLQEITGNFRKAEKTSIILMNEFFQNFAIALSNVINILDPDVVILGGGLSNINEVYSYGVPQVLKNIFNDHPRNKILKNQCGDSAGVYGAALIGN